MYPQCGLEWGMWLGESKLTGGVWCHHCLATSSPGDLLSMWLGNNRSDLIIKWWRTLKEVTHTWASMGHLAWAQQMLATINFLTTNDENLFLYNYINALSQHSIKMLPSQIDKFLKRVGYIALLNKTLKFTKVKVHFIK